jgi:hypothetical protein
MSAKILSSHGAQDITKVMGYLLVMDLEFCWGFCSNQVSWILGSQVRNQLG